MFTVCSYKKHAVIYRIFFSQTYAVIDAKYYASNSRINTENFEYNNDRYLFYSTYHCSLGDEVHFRFKNAPTTAIAGFGTYSPSITNQFLIYKQTSGRYDIIRNASTNPTNVNATHHCFCTSQDLVIKIGTDPNGYRANIYQGDTYQTYWFFQLDNPNIRLDKFIEYDYEVEIFVL